MKKNPNTIDLGKTFESLPDLEAADPKEASYPTFFVGGVDGIENLPDGDFDFSGKGRVSSCKEVTDRTGKKVYSCEIEVYEITPEDGGKSPTPKKDSGDMLSAKMDEIAQKKSDAADTMD